MIAITVTAALLAIIPQALASFAWDCSWWYLSGHSLMTGCATWGSGDDERVTSTLDLNECIGIDPGGNAMVWEKGCACLSTFLPTHSWTRLSASRDSELCVC